MKGATAAASSSASRGGAAAAAGGGGDLDDVDLEELENDPTFEAPFEHRVVTLEPGADFKSKYGIFEELGRGRFGVVFKVRRKRRYHFLNKPIYTPIYDQVVDKNTNETFAAKFIRCRKQEERQKVNRKK